MIYALMCLMLGVNQFYVVDPFNHMTKTRAKNHDVIY